jgi:hypothetical protein
MIIYRDCEGDDRVRTGRNLRGGQFPVRYIPSNFGADLRITGGKRSHRTWGVVHGRHGVLRCLASGERHVAVVVRPEDDHLGADHVGAKATGSMV